MSDEIQTKRKYELKQRADDMAAMRLRITEAAVELHGTIGPARTTMSAIAKRAGVQRHTVYRHFPTDDDLYSACSAHYATSHPLPDPEPWRAIGDPAKRLVRALDEMYAYYERTEPMLSNVLRDLELVAAVGPAIAGIRGFQIEVARILAAGWPTRGRRRCVLTAALDHVLDFQTWRSLTAGDRITRAEAVELAAELVKAAAAGRPGASG